MTLRHLTLLILALFLTTQCTNQITSMPHEESSHSKQLAPLSWLIGSWEDSDSEGSFTATYDWGLNQNFIKQSFTLQFGEESPLHGEQYIGWDPVRKEIRSWAFDSDGGYGESVWSKDGSSWYVTMSYTLNDGGRASATHVFTYVDETTYTFSSLNRDVNGAILPDIGPYTNTRVQKETK